MKTFISKYNFNKHFTSDKLSAHFYSHCVKYSEIIAYRAFTESIVKHLCYRPGDSSIRASICPNIAASRPEEIWGIQLKFYNFSPNMDK